jgi:hypothetical protein
MDRLLFWSIRDNKRTATMTQKKVAFGCAFHPRRTTSCFSKHGPGYVQVLPYVAPNYQPEKSPDGGLRGLSLCVDCSSLPYLRLKVTLHVTPLALFLRQELVHACLGPISLILSVSVVGPWMCSARTGGCC